MNFSVFLSMFGDAPGSSDDVICVPSLGLSLGPHSETNFHGGKCVLFHVKNSFSALKFRV